MKKILLFAFRNENGAKASLFQPSVFRTIVSAFEGNTCEEALSRPPIASTAFSKMEVSFLGGKMSCDVEYNEDILESINSIDGLSQFLDSSFTAAFEYLLKKAHVEANELKVAGKDHLCITPSYVLEMLPSKQIIYAAWSVDDEASNEELARQMLAIDNSCASLCLDLEMETADLRKQGF